MSPQMRAEFWWKTATSADVSASGWTFTVSGPPASTSTAVGAAFRGVDTATGADLGFADGNFSNSGTGGWSDNWSANSTATSLTVPGVTTVGVNRLAVTFTVSAANGVTFTPPSGYNEQIDTTYTTGRNIEVATKALPTAGATGSVQTTTSTGSGLVGYHLTLKPVTTSGTTTTVTYTRDAADRVIERKVNGTTVARYAHTAAGDSPQLVLNATNTVVERNVALPGGVLLTTRGTSATDVWSYRNSHGDITATTNGSGVKQGATRGYDPWGNPLGTTTLPDNNTGNWDYTWHGAQQRPLEHEAGLTPVIEMGARQYAPQLGRFLETDPIEGGSANDYVYPNDQITFDDIDWLIKRRRLLLRRKALNGGLTAEIWTINRRDRDKSRGQNRAMFEITIALLQRLETVGGSVAICPQDRVGPCSTRTLTTPELGLKGRIHASIAGVPGERFQVYGYWLGATRSATFLGTFVMPDITDSNSN